MEFDKMHITIEDYMHYAQCTNEDIKSNYLMVQVFGKIRNCQDISKYRLCRISAVQKRSINTLLQKIRGTNFRHKIFQSDKNTRYLGVARWNFDESQYMVLNQAGTPVAPDNT